jgi:hypothetical protein
MSVLRQCLVPGCVVLSLAASVLATEPRRAVHRGQPAPVQDYPLSTNAVPAKRSSDQLRERVATLPPPAEGVEDLYFDEFFKTPVGRFGLETSERLLSLDGKRVRILGFMVKQARSTPWTLLLTPFPLKTHEVDYDLADELPANTVRVFLPKSSQPVTPYTPGLLLLTGRLEVGDREEADGRHSVVRLHVDPKAPTPIADAPAPTKPAVPAEPLSTAEPVRR